MTNNCNERELTIRDDELLKLAKKLDNSDEYCVIYKYKKPKYYNLSDELLTNTKKFIGAFL